MLKWNFAACSRSVRQPCRPEIAWRLQAAQAEPCRAVRERFVPPGWEARALRQARMPAATPLRQASFRLESALAVELAQPGRRGPGNLFPWSVQLRHNAGIPRKTRG
jgi:hypothetical protein